MTPPRLPARFRQREPAAVDGLPRNVLPSVKFRRTVLALLLTVGFVAGCFAWLEIRPFRFFTQFHFIRDLVREMLPPRFSLLWTDPHLWNSIGETIAMAFLGTAGGGAIAFVLGFLAAGNTSPHPAIRQAVRGLLSAQRCAPDFAIMMVIVIAVGFGPFAGTIALVIGSTGMFGKFFADAIEQVDMSQVEGVRVAGSNRLNEIRFGVLPQVLPSFVANGLYLFEINMGGAIALGVFGGGGLGFELNIANAVLNYPAMLAYILFIVLLMILTEKLSDRIRKGLLGAGTQLK
ncbi:MAG: phosphonate ABC transporter, permease protein PhnE [Opitutales bacterium]